MSVSAKMQHVIIKKAVTMLVAAEIDYAILTPDGELLGTLDVRREDDPVPVRRANAVNNWVEETGYPDRIKALAVGELITFEIENPTVIAEGTVVPRTNSFSAALNSAGMRYLGRDNFIVTSEEGHFEFLRVA